MTTAAGYVVTNVDRQTRAVVILRRHTMMRLYTPEMVNYRPQKKIKPPELTVLDVMYNKVTQFMFSCFDPHPVEPENTGSPKPDPIDPKHKRDDDQDDPGARYNETKDQLIRSMVSGLQVSAQGYAKIPSTEELYARVSVAMDAYLRRQAVPRQVLVQLIGPECVVSFL
jgi:hypothetical protein